MQIELDANEFIALRAIEIRLRVFITISDHLCIFVSFDSLSASMVDEISTTFPIPSNVECLQTSGHNTRSTDYHLLLRSLVTIVDSSVIRHL